MASQATGRGGNTTSDAINSGHEHVADAQDDAADTNREKRTSALESATRYTRNATDKLHDAANYVRENDVEDMGRDAMRAATAHPMASLLVLSAVVLGGSMIVAALLQPDRHDDGSGQSRGPMRLASAVNGLGPRGTETLNRIRDAAFSFLLAKAVDTVDGMFPGFREHYERA